MWRKPEITHEPDGGISLSNALNLPYLTENLAQKRDRFALKKAAESPRACGVATRISIPIETG